MAQGLDINVWLNDMVYGSGPILMWNEKYSERWMWVEGCNKLNPSKGFWGFCWRGVCKALSCPLYVVHKIKGTKYISHMCDE